MSDDKCGICGAILGSDYYSAYTPYPTHADKSICVANIRADEREKIARAIEEAHKTAPDWYIRRAEAARIARNGGNDE